MKKHLFTLFVFLGLMINSGRCQTIDSLVDVGGYRLHFHIIKGKGMPILFETGAGGDVTDWNNFLETISGVTKTTLIAYDRSGFGKSELDSSNHDLNKHGILHGIEGLETALKKLGYEEDIMLIAHSFGGFCATLYAARHPATVKAAVLIDANQVCWFKDNYVDSVTKLKNAYYDTAKNINLANYYMGLNLRNTVNMLRKTPFPANIPVIDLVSEINFPDSVSSARWSVCHRQFVESQPGNRQGITAYGCGHFIFRDNPLLVVSAIVKAYTGAVGKEQGDEITKRFVTYSLEEADNMKRREVKGHH